MPAIIFDLDATLLHNGNRLHDGTADLLRLLRNLGFRVGAVSDHDHRALVRLEEAGIRHFFDDVVCSDHRVSPKSPISIQRMVEKLGVELEHSTLVSYLHDDILSGKHAGLGQTIRVVHGDSADERHFVDADHVVRHLPAVLDVIS